MCFAGSWGAACLADERWLLFARRRDFRPPARTSVALDNPRASLGRQHRPRSLSLVDAAGADLRETSAGEVTKRVFIPAGRRRPALRPTASVRCSLTTTGSGSAQATVWPCSTTSKPFTAKNVFAGQPVVGMTPSLDGRSMWVSNNAGLLEIDTRTLREVSRVTKADGLIDDEAWAYGPLATDSAGPHLPRRRRAASPSSIPPRARRNTAAPIVRLRDVEMRRENEIELEYAALSFADESRNRYRTRLDRLRSELVGRNGGREDRATRTCRPPSSRATTHSK